MCCLPYITMPMATTAGNVFVYFITKPYFARNIICVRMYVLKCCFREINEI